VLGRLPFDVGAGFVDTFDRELTNPLGSPLNVLSPTWINTGPDGSAFPDPFDIPMETPTTSDWNESVPEVTGDGGKRVSVASLIGVVGSSWV